MLQAVRQVRQIRVKFFQSILRQNVGFFDLNSSGELNTRLAEYEILPEYISTMIYHFYVSCSDVQKIQDGISDKVSISIQMFARALAGLVIGFVYSWKLALVILAVSPLLGISAAMLFKVSRFCMPRGCILIRLLLFCHVMSYFGGFVLRNRYD